METPILLLVYNRPNQTARMLKRLKQCGVKNVFVSADGPKNAEDRMLTKEVRFVLKRFDSIIRNSRFSEKNLDCKNAVISGIDWFFNQVEEGIILEDDCLPSPHFFPFVEDMLSRYRDEQKVMMIGGNNPLGEWQTDGGHFFSRIGTIWGWATWKDRWKSFHAKLPELDKFIANRGFERAFGPTKLAESRLELTLKSIHGEIDTWDYQWNAHLLSNNGLAVIPEQNLVENIGFDSDGTNVHDKPNWIVNEVIDKPLNIASRPIIVDREFEMEWELARRSNSPANVSSKSFEKKGENEKRKLRILLINSTDMGGGAEKIAFTLHQKLLEFGNDTELLVQVKKSDLESVQEIADWRSQLTNFQPDVIHVHNLHGTSIPLDELANISKRIPLLFTLHDSWLTTGSIEHPFALNPEKLNLLELLDWKKEFGLRRKAIENGNFRFTAPSQWMRELFFNMHGIRPFYVQNAIEKAGPNAGEIPSERFILIVANRPETNPYKDFSTLKKAWKKANEKLGENGCDLIVLGGEPKTEKVGNRTLFIIEKQPMESVLAFMQKSLLVVQSSLQDNAPLTVLETHSIGKNVVGSLVGGIPELMTEQEQNWLYEVGNDSDLTEKLILALESESKGTSQLVHTVDSMVNTYLGHYLSLINA